MHDITDLLEAMCEGEPRKMSALPRWLDDYASSSQVASAHRTMLNQRMTSAATSALFDNQKIIPIDNASGWNSMLVAADRATDGFATPVCPAIVVVLRSEMPVRLRYAPVVGLGDIDDIPGRPIVGDDRMIEIEQGCAFVIPHGPYAFKLEPVTGCPVFLRFNGPMRSSLTFAFPDARSSAAAISFGSADDTGRHFFASLVEELTKPGSPLSAAALSAEDKVTFTTGLNDLIESDVHHFSRWKLIQALGRHRPGDAVAHLKVLSESANANIRQKAQAALGISRCN
jgi:hypothetical protein